jgi:hypothetical protein
MKVTTYAEHGKETIVRNAVVSHPHRLNSPAPLHMRSLAVTALAVWLAFAFWLGARGFFVTPAGTPPIRLLLGVLIPIAVLLFAYRVWLSFRDFVLQPIFVCWSARKRGDSPALGFSH